MSLASVGPDPHFSCTSALLQSGLARVSEQFNLIVSALTAEEYRRSFGRTSIGSHARHAIDFMEMLIAGLPQREIPYNAGPRKTHYEQDLILAQSAMSQAVERLSGALEALTPDYALTVYQIVNETAPAVAVPSSLGRETMSVMEHAIHHFATISVMGLLIDVAMDPKVGMAADTCVFRSS